MAGARAPLLDVQLPWAAIPVPWFALAFWIAYRNEDRLRDRDSGRCSGPPSGAVPVGEQRVGGEPALDRRAS